MFEKDLDELFPSNVTKYGNRPHVLIRQSKQVGNIDALMSLYSIGNEPIVPTAPCGLYFFRKNEKRFRKCFRMKHVPAIKVDPRTKSHREQYRQYARPSPHSPPPKLGEHLLYYDKKRTSTRPPPSKRLSRRRKILIISHALLFFHPIYIRLLIFSSGSV